MKKLIFTLSCICVVLNVNFAQIVRPVKWAFEAKKVSDTEFDLVATAKLDKGWYIYTQDIKGDDGPIPTKFTFNTTPQYQLVGGRPNEVSDHKKSGFDKIFEMNVTKYSTMVQFVQRVKVNAASANITGTIEYGTCDDEKCLPPQDENFSYTVSTSNGAAKQQAAPQPVPQTAPKQIPTSQNAPQQIPPQYPKANPQPTTPQKTIPAKSDVKNKDKSAGQLFEVQPVTPKPEPATTNKLSNHVAWTFEAAKVTDIEYDIVAKATIDKGWHIYSQFLKGDGPIPTTITIDNAEKVGTSNETSPQRRERNDPNFDNMKVIDFGETATFTQRLKIKDAAQPITGKVEWMACDEGHCTPPQEETFSVNLSGGQSVAAVAQIDTTQKVSVTENGIYTQPSQFNFDKADINNTCTTKATSTDDYSNLWWVFIQGLLGGFLAILMPCIFPLIPMTVAYFTKGSQDRATGIRNAVIYGLSIVVIYVVLGTLVSTIFGSDALNRFASNAWVNIGFGVLFLAFAFSFFGYYEMTLPNSWTNKADAASHKGGLMGIFFMAFTLALVSFSCTGPIIGNLLVQSAGGSSLAPIIGMLGFGVALGMPFALFAAFPAWLKTLPKSGGWMDDLKVTFGFVEIALAFKFFSNADLAKNWKFLPYEGFLVIWILCALGLALYYIKVYKVHGHLCAIKSAVTRGGLVAVCLAIMAYCASGFRYNEVTHTFKTPNLLSGLTPPAGYSYIYPSQCPLNINCFHDLNEGLAEAKRQNKPILLDFTGYSCANCRKMENYVWPEQGVRELIEGKYILVSLYVDDPKELKAPYQKYTSTFDNRIKKDYGDMWADWQAQHFNQNTQPYYVLLSPNGKILNNPKGTTLEVKEYQSFLECGLSQFDKVKLGANGQPEVISSK
jgi:thiol:disulfide interchange protein